MDEAEADSIAGHRRMPRDVIARRRLQRAQQVEASAVSAVYQAEAALTRVRARHDAAIAAANEEFAIAEEGVRGAQRSLIEISGLERAAALLGTDRAQLRRISAARPARQST
jgi:hypothetical protein